ncbi:MAG: Stp1/IreP family PP2C-type Ser/Thr phosphatase [Chloroflexi bacterium]|nr:Stp1/IreP family PP2C-type Ser/Thr phosphatase [Chloroflexota bacterium]
MAEKIVRLDGQTIRLGFKTDRGQRRRKNEDHLDIFIPPDEKTLHAKGILCAVADGMGGHAAGEVASHRAVEVVIDTYYHAEGSETQNLLEQSVKAANRRIYAESKRVAEYADMGTTLVATVAHDGKLFWAHVGDSRVYQLHADELAQLTEDHSYTEILVQSGALTRQEAERDSRSNIVTRSLGGTEDIEVDLGWAELHNGDTFILCSDGLRRELEDDEIAILANGSDAQASAEALVLEANARGGRDNISVIIIKVGEPEPVELRRTPTLKIRRSRAASRKIPPFAYGFIVALLLLACVGTGWGLYQQATLIAGEGLKVVQQTQTAIAIALVPTATALSTATIAPSATLASPSTAIKTATQTATSTATPTNSPTWIPTPTFTATSQPTPVPTPCPSGNFAHFVEDVTIPDKKEIPAGKTFTKTWRIQNRGNCSWSSSYSIVFADGNQMGAPNSSPFPEGDISPNGQVGLSLDMIAPIEVGQHRGNWVLQDPSGQEFGVDGVSLYVIIRVIPASPTPKVTAAPTSTPSLTPMTTR